MEENELARKSDGRRESRAQGPYGRSDAAHKPLVGSVRWSIHRADIRRCIREGPTLLAVQRDLLVQTSSAACCAARPRPAITDRRRGWRRANPTAARFLANYPSDSACAR